MIRKLIFGALASLALVSSAHAQNSTILRLPDGSGPIPATTSGLRVQGAGSPGSPAGGVVSIQGVPSGTALPVSQSGAWALDTLTTVTSITNAIGIKGVNGTTIATNANPIPISDAGGSLTVDGTVAVSGSVAVTGPLTDTQLRATAVPVSGTVTANIGTAGTLATAALQGAQGTGATYNPPTGGSGQIGYLSGIYAAAIDPAPVAVTLSSSATGGCTPYGYQSAASTNATSVKASAGTLCSLNVINTTATLYYVRLYNLAAAPTCSSATGFVKTIPVPASTTGAGVALDLGAFGEAYSTGLAFCLTGGGSSTDNTNAAAGVYLSASYK